MTSYTAGDNPSNGGCFEYKASFLLFILSSPNLYLGSLGSIVGVTKYRLVQKYCLVKVKQ